VDDIKCKIEEQDGIPPDQQRLVFAGRLLHDGTLEDNGVQEG
jgi:ubiquitin